MKKILTSNTEKIRILQMHGFLREQVQPSETEEQILDRARKQGCIAKYTWFTPDEGIRRTKSGKSVITGKGSNGDTYYFYGNMDVVNVNTKTKKTWTCEKINTDSLNDNEGNNLGLNQKQNDYIAALSGETGIEYFINPSEGQKLNLKPIKITDAPKELFPNGLTLWYDPNKQSGLKKDDTAIGKQLENQQINRNTCRTYITEFYTSFKRRNSIVLDPASFELQKNRTQSCKDAYYNKWGVLGGGNQLDQYLDILSGDKPGGPLSDSKWRIE